MRVEFLNEAKRLFDLESGKGSLPTVQALLIMYICCAGMGRDRAGMMFRSVAYEMLRSLRLEDVRLGAASEAEATARAIDANSRALWGIYCFERLVSLPASTRGSLWFANLHVSISSFAYLQPGLVRKPSVPRRFLTRSSSMAQSEELWSDEQLSPSILYAMCDLSDIYNDVMSYTVSLDGETGSEADVLARASYLRQVRALHPGLPAQLQLGAALSPAVYLLRYEPSILSIKSFRSVLILDLQIIRKPGATEYSSSATPGVNFTTDWGGG